MTTEDQDKVLLTAVQTASAMSQAALSKVEQVDGSLREMNVRMETMNDRLGTMNAHLENIGRESAKTTHILEEEAEARKEREKYERDLEVRKLDRQEEVEDKTRAAYLKFFTEVWDIFRKPVGFLVTGVVAWLLYTYFQTGV